MSFEEHIKEWVSIDNQIRIYNDKLKELREKRTERSENIIQYVETQNLQNATVQISDGKLRFSETKQQTPLTLHYVKSCLTNCISDPEKVEQIMQYIKNSRETKIVSNIKRSYTN
tara:strand:+ start:2545 stop:2889 length:345 start_codon:yes stop_codon:yes gene_type:complete